jgi:CxxC-x17-CxxC domain-containing protein
MNKFRKPHGNGMRNDRGGFGGRDSQRPSFGESSPTRFGNNNSYRPDSSRAGFGGRRRGEDKQLFDAVCSKCGNKCQVPFRPTGQKPVYCNACFSEQLEGSRGRFSNRDNRDNHSRSFESRMNNRGMENNVNVDNGNFERQIVAVNYKIDSILEILKTISQSSSNIEKSKNQASVSQDDSSKKKIVRKKSAIKK